jgi:hypothetical protein
MRQVGTLPDEREATRFAAWLVTQRIEAHAEQEGEQWAIWVREEDRLHEAREALAHFREHSQDAKYQGAERTAEALLREEEAKRRQGQSNVVEMRGRWGMPGSIGGGVARRCPLVLAIAAASILVAIVTDRRIAAASCRACHLLPQASSMPAATCGRAFGPARSGG